MFYVMRQFFDEYGEMRVAAARVAPYKTEEEAKKKMNKVGKGAFLISRHHTVVAVYGITH